MHPQKKTWLVINVVGGAAVLASYAHGLLTHPQTRNLLWGDMPYPLRDVYGVTMWLATVGYLAFMYYAFFRIDAAEGRVGKYSAFSVINACCAAVVFPSALWMPLTFAYLSDPSRFVWAAIRVDLIVVGVGAVGLIVTHFTLSPRATGWASLVAVVGLLFFALQTAFLDPFVWPVFFAG